MEPEDFRGFSVIPPFGVLKGCDHQKALSSECTIFIGSNDVDSLRSHLPNCAADIDLRTDLVGSSSTPTNAKPSGSGPLPI